MSLIYNIFLIFILTVPDGLVKIFPHHEQQIKCNENKRFNVEHKDYEQLSIRKLIKK